MRRFAVTMGDARGGGYGADDVARTILAEGLAADVAVTETTAVGGELKTSRWPGEQLNSALAAVREHPLSTARELSTFIVAARGTSVTAERARFLLEDLERLGFVRCEQRGRKRLWAEVTAGGEGRVRTVSALWSEWPNAGINCALAAVREHPVATARELSSLILGRDGMPVSAIRAKLLLLDLERLGFVRRERRRQQQWLWTTVEPVS
jgi:hypothetical protein